MMKPFVCGTFHLEEEDEERFSASPVSSPRKAKKGSFFKSKGCKHNNPYSTRGLDKFSALLADLDERRQKIYSRMNPQAQDISSIPFLYTKTDEFVPVVIKAKNRDRKSKSEELKVKQPVTSSNSVVSMDIKSATETESAAAMEERKQSKLLQTQKKAEKKRLPWIMKRDAWERPYFYVPVVMVLILLFLAVFGRSTSTLCTCIVWYIVPTLKDSSKPKKSMNQKKDYVRGFSEMNMGSGKDFRSARKYLVKII